MVVLNTVEDGPAARGGVLPGDVVVNVDGVDALESAEVVAARCRGTVGTEVNVSVLRRGNGGNGKDVLQFSLTRAQVKAGSVMTSMVQSVKHDKRLFVVRVPVFSQETVSQVIDALKEMRDADAIVMDLRGNAGGYMPAGVDVAKLFLPPKTRVISEIDKTGRATIYVSDGIGSNTDMPLYLLVDKRTASASEIVTAALQDNKRAVVVGGTNTFGKGRIQNVQELEGGSGIAVTKAKYITPLGKDIHGVGITPNEMSNTCETNDSASACLAAII